MSKQHSLETYQKIRVAALKKRIAALEKIKEPEKKDIWDKIKIGISILTTVIVAVATYIGGVYIPQLINENDTETKKLINNQTIRSLQISKLSDLVPNVYKDTSSLRPSVISMSAFGSSSVPVLLMIWEDASDKYIDFERKRAAHGLDSAPRLIFEKKRDNEGKLIRTVKSAINFIGPEAREALLTKIQLEIQFLRPDGVNNKSSKFISELINLLDGLTTEDSLIYLDHQEEHNEDIFSFFSFSNASDDKPSELVNAEKFKIKFAAILKFHFAKVGQFGLGSTDLKAINTAALIALSNLDGLTEDIYLNKIVFAEGSIFNEVNFKNANLVGTSFFDCTLMNCNFESVKTDKTTDFQLCKFVSHILSQKDKVLEYYKLANSGVKGSMIDNTLLLILEEISRTSVIDTSTVMALIKTHEERII